MFVDVGLCALFGTSSAQEALLVSMHLTDSVVYMFWSYLHRWIYRVGDQGRIDTAHDGVDKNLHGMDHLSYPCGTQNSHPSREVTERSKYGYDTFVTGLDRYWSRSNQVS